jgi:hypothetical protein
MFPPTQSMGSKEQAMCFVVYWALSWTCVYTMSTM